MDDEIVLATCFNLLVLFVVDYLGIHNFGVEATLTVIGGFLLLVLHQAKKGGE